MTLQKTTNTNKDSPHKITLSASDMETAIATLMSKAKKRRNPPIISEGDGEEGSTSAMETTSKNALSDLIPGYTAPMSLDSSSSSSPDKFKRNSGNRNSNRNSNRNDSSNHESVLKNAAAQSNIKRIETKPTGFQSKNFKMAKKDPLIKAKQESNAGSGWFGFEAAPNSASLQADIAIIRNRNYIDPKKFYKKSDMGKKGERRLIQLGTVIEGSMESVYSNRLSKKQRKTNLLEEVMGETFQTKDDYVKRKYTNMQREKSSLSAKRKKRGKR